MPLYTYTCDSHGQFSAWGQMSESEAPQPCPSCESPAPRALARPAIGGRNGESEMSCGMGACESPGSMASMAGGCCGGGACVH